MSAQVCRKFRHLSISIIAVVIASLPVFADTCVPRQVEKIASAKAIRNFVKGKKMKVLTFTGYSGAEYEGKAGMLETAGQILDSHDPDKTLVNIGATAEGIGAIYDLAKEKGFHTMGIVSVLAKDEKVPLSPCVEFVFFVRDNTWGGNLPGTTKLSPTSAAMVSVSSELVGIGGGEVSRDELLAARKTGKPVRFFPQRDWVCNPVLNVSK
jgi:hypothetical protein